MISTYASYKMATKDIAQTIKRVEEQPIVSRDIDYYQENITKVKSIDDFLSDTRLFTFAMKAFGLGEMSYAKAFMRKVLEEGVADKSSFANSLSDTKYRDFAEMFNFDTFGDATTAFTKVQEGVVDMYLRQTLEEQAGKDNEGVRLALYFERKAPKMTNYYEILADKALGKVVRTALGMPDSMAAADVDKQVAQFKKHFDLADFQDPKKLDEFLSRFTSLWEIDHGQQSSLAVQQVGLLFGQRTQGIGMDLMLQIQQLKR